MAGLLDWIAGDDQIKDAEGLTQADRRQPYWQAAQSSLAKMGGLLMAAGQPLHNEQRAAYLAQAGGALGGFGADVMNAKSEMAKQRLAQQTITTNRTKLANQQKLQAYVASPEGQAILAKMPAPARLAAQMAVDLGDADAFGRAVSGVDLAEHRNRMAEIREGVAKQKEDALARKEDMLPAEPNRAAFGFLLRGQKDPAFTATAEYDWALNHASKEQRAADGSTTPGIDRDDYPPSRFVRPGASPPAPGAAPAEKTPRQLAQELKPGEEKTLPNGIVISKSLTGVLEWEVPGVGDREPETYQLPPGGRETKQPPRKPIESGALGVLTATTNTLKDLDELDTELKKPGVQLGNIATYLLPNNALNLTNPEGVRARAIIAGIAAKKVNDLSGAAVSAEEYKRIEPFIPKPTDLPEIALTKLKGLRRELEDIGRARFYNIPGGSRISPELRARFGGGGRTSTPAPQGDGTKPGRVPVKQTPDGKPLYQHSNGQLYLVPEE